MIFLEKIIRSGEEAELIDISDGIGRIKLLSKGNSISPKVREFIATLLDDDLAGLAGVVIVNEGKNFSVGADLTAMKQAIERGEYGDTDSLNTYQELLLRLKTYHKPIVAAPYKNVLGGGLELCMHCHKRVAFTKLYMGLVEVGVGLLPGGGGLKEAVLRISETQEDEKEQMLLSNFQSLLLRSTSKNAQEAKEMGYLRADDVIVDDENLLLDTAKQECLKMAANYVPETEAQNIGLGGKKYYEMLLKHAETMLKDELISPYDVEIGKRIALVLTGSDTDENIVMNEREILRLENASFTDLKKQDGSYQRIQYFLKTGEMLRN